MAVDPFCTWRTSWGLQCLTKINLRRLRLGRTGVVFVRSENRSLLCSVLGLRTTVAWGVGVKKILDRFQNSRCWFQVSSLERCLRFSVVGFWLVSGGGYWVVLAAWDERTKVCSREWAVPHYECSMSGIGVPGGCNGVAGVGSGYHTRGDICANS
jgi:hypothetical protein